MAKVEYTVVVHKASVPLMNDESIHSFTMALRNAGAESMKTKLNLTRKSDTYMVEAFGSTAIFNVYKYDGIGLDTGPKYYAMSYSRDVKSGAFTFGDIVEVKRKTVYEKASPLTKAVWSAAQINELPDAAFAIVLPGGKKDKFGKTVPRTLRMLPHHNSSVKSPTENGSVDLPHLRNGLARVNQAKMSPEQKAKAKAHLQAHAKELLGAKKGCRETKKEATDATWLSAAPAASRRSSPLR